MAVRETGAAVMAVEGWEERVREDGGGEHQGMPVVLATGAVARGATGLEGMVGRVTGAEGKGVRDLVGTAERGMGATGRAATGSEAEGWVAWG